MTARVPLPGLFPAAAIAAICVAVGVLAGVAPWMAVVAALGLAFLALTFTSLAAGLVVFVVVVFAESTPIAGPVLSFTKLVGLVLVLAWVAQLASRPAASERLIFNDHPKLTYVLVAFLGWVAISVSWSTDPSAALTEGSRLLLVAILFMIVYTAVSTRREVVWVLAGLATGAAGTAVYGLVVRPEIAGRNPERLVSTVEDPNALAALLVVGFALSAAGFVASKGHPPLRLAASGSALLCLAAFVLTGSRGGVVAFGVALAVAVIAGGRNRSRVAAGVALVVSASLVFYGFYAPEDIRDRVAAATQGETASAGSIERQEGRVTIWTVAWRVVEDNPVLGAGVGNFRIVSPDYVLEPGALFRTDEILDDPSAAHNTYLHVFAELGLVGVSMFLAIVGISFMCAVRAAQTFARAGDWRMEVLTRGLVIGTAGMLAAIFFISEVSGKVVWLLLALGPALLGVARSGDRRPDDDPAASS